MDPTGQKTGGVSAGDGGAIISSGDMSGGVTVSPEPITSSPGDEIIASSPSGPQLLANRKLILGVVLAVLVLVGAAIIFVVTNQRTTEEETIAEAVESTPVNADYVPAFNRYANYILNGTDSAIRITGEFKASKQYKIDKILASNSLDVKKEFFEQAQNLLDSFEEAYQTANPGNSIHEDFSIYLGAFDFLRAYALNQNDDDQDIIDSYLSANEGIDLEQAVGLNRFNAVEGCWEMDEYMHLEEKQNDEE